MNQTYQNSVKVPKVVKPTNKKTLLKDLGTCAFNSTMSQCVPYAILLKLLEESMEHH